jgi:hypothetical protein
VNVSVGKLRIGKRLIRISRLNYDKVHRCPSWAGSGFSCVWTGYRYDAGEVECNGSFAPLGGIYYDLDGNNRKHWQWRFVKCNQCGIICLPYITRWLDPSYLKWKVEKFFQRLYDKWYYRY